MSLEEKMEKKKKGKPIQLSMLNELKSSLKEHFGLTAFYILFLLLRNPLVLLSPIE